MGMEIVTIKHFRLIKYFADLEYPPTKIFVNSAVLSPEMI